MELYHLSDGRYETLEPMVGENRHEGEDPDVVGEPAVFLASVVGTSSPPKQYCHVVEVPADDADLRLDEGVASLMAGASGVLFDGDAPFQWYYLYRSVEVIEIREWNEETRSYEAIWTRE